MVLSPIIDADTHVTECDATFSYVDEADLRFVPSKGEMTTASGARAFWLIDGLPRNRRRPNDADPWSIMGELLDIPARLKAMDGMGVETQIIYPTTFSSGGIESAEAELALTRSYNRWLADRTSTSGGRLRWVMLPSLHNLDKAIEEMRWAKDHGACGVLKKGDREAGKWLNDPYFFPLYEEAQKLDMPLCFHLGSGTPDYSPAREFSSSRYLRTRLPVLHGFHSLLVHGVPAQFPKLRFGFVETGASWVPAVLYDVQRTIRHAKETAGTSNISSAGASDELGSDAVRQNRMYVTCHSDEDLPYLLRVLGEDNLMMGSDYTHSDPGSEWQFRKSLQARSDIPAGAVDKITYANAKRFYGL